MWDSEINKSSVSNFLNGFTQFSVVPPIPYKVENRFVYLRNQAIMKYETKNFIKVCPANFSLYSFIRNN
jgi:hypothetical protein